MWVAQSATDAECCGKRWLWLGRFFHCDGCGITLRFLWLDQTTEVE